MLKARKRRLVLIAFIVAMSSIVVSMLLYTLRHHISLYYTPSQVYQDHVAANQHFRLGGLVMAGSVHQSAKHSLVTFTLTDPSHRAIVVKYRGLLPSLFREGQGIIADGKLNQHHVFIADQVLAKHDSDYHPPGVSSSYH